MEWRDTILMWALVDIVSFRARGSMQKIVAFGDCPGKENLCKVGGGYGVARLPIRTGIFREGFEGLTGVLKEATSGAFL